MIKLKVRRDFWHLLFQKCYLLVIPKANSLFSFAIGKMLFTLRGSHLKYRPGDRSARKFKEKPLTVKDLEYQ